MKKAGLMSKPTEFQKHIERLQATLVATHQGWFEIDLTTRMAVVNEQYAVMLAFDPTNFVESLDTWLERIHPDDLPEVRSVYNEYYAGRRPDYRVEFRERNASGDWIWILSVGAFVDFDENAMPSKLAGTRINICTRKEAEQRQREADRRFHLTTEAAQLGDFTLDLRTGTTLHSLQHDRCFGYSKRVENWDYAIFLAHIVDEDRARIDSIIHSAIADGSDYEIEFRVRWPDGTEHWLWSKGSFFFDDEGQPARAAGIVGDITTRKQAAAEIHQLAYADQLTGLPNRRWLINHIDKACKTARQENWVDAILFLDLDGFKRVNDARGHAVGDALLKSIADRIKTAVAVRGTVGRIGGDEFVIHFANIAKRADQAIEAAMAAASEVATAITAPLEIEGHLYDATVSIGVTVLTDTSATAADLLREADTAMYRAKAAGRNRVAVYETRMRFELETQLELERDLSLALARQELDLHCQPQVDHAGTLTGAELLLRWAHPEKGYVSPAVFIALAEESDLIIRIGTWVIDKACRIEVESRRRGILVPLSINISPKQFKDPNFIAEVIDSIHASKAHANRLIFEITEGLLIEDIHEAVERMEKLRSLGIRFSIDDFGTGYSSLAYLKKLPLYELKIAKSFVDGLPDDTGDAAIVQSILAIAKHLKFRVVAEGVEKKDQAEFLKAAGCDGFQGYLFARPESVATFLSNYGSQRVGGTENTGG
jgi:diguanylate cyclase (GGDEF)-like protein/PAS domain S-box-containing protein